MTPASPSLFPSLFLGGEWVPAVIQVNGEVAGLPLGHQVWAGRMERCGQVLTWGWGC